MMISIAREFTLCAYTILTFLLLTTAVSSTSCNRSCHKKRLHYPFGFSEGCPIRLNCTDNSVRIGEFEVQKVTSKIIKVRLPPKCNRSIESIAPLFHRNYVATWRNGLLLHNCSTTSTTANFNSCVIPRALLKTQFSLDQGCDRAYRPYCLSKEKEMKQGSVRNVYMAFDNVSRSGCKFLYSSVAVVVDSGSESDSSSLVSIEFQTVVLAWWLEGNCSSCAPNANCTKIVSPFNGNPSFRCQCLEGYKGDGFLAGNGCRKVSTQCYASKYLSGQCGATSRIVVLIGGLVAGALLVAGLVLLCYVLRKWSISNRNRNNTKLLLSETPGGFSVPFYTYKEIERATYSFSEKYRIGVGAYGTVYAGKFHDDEWVAIKKIRYGDRDAVGQVMNEIKLLSSVSHPNLVRLLGFCLEKGEQILVYEFMPNGTLSQHLQRERGTGLPWTIRLNIAAETAEAVAHLHSAIDPPIYHRDIKSSNILLDHSYSSKVADFGLSRLGMADLSYISTAPQGTPGYLDPQYHQNFHLSDKSDVYSFGVVLAEIITALKVVDFSRPQNEVNLAALVVEKIAKECLDEIIDPFLEPNRDAWTLSSIHRVAELAFRCLAFHRDMRPSMKEVAAELEQIKISGWAPLEENFCIPSSVGSFCSSPSNGIEMSTEMKLKKVGAKSRKVIVLRRDDCVISTGEIKDNSPVSVQDMRFSDQSSPSSNCMLGISPIHDHHTGALALDYGA